MSENQTALLRKRDGRGTFALRFFACHKGVSSTEPSINKQGTRRGVTTPAKNKKELKATVANGASCAPRGAISRGGWLLTKLNSHTARPGMVPTQPGQLTPPARPFHGAVHFLDCYPTVLLNDHLQRATRTDSQGRNRKGRLSFSFQGPGPFKQLSFLGFFFVRKA